MPSGSKKRKASKKKKENQPSNPDLSNYASAQSQGSDDVKHQDDKESDEAGEVSSPVSDDCCSHGSSPLAKGEKEGIVVATNDLNPLPKEGVTNEGADETNVAVEEVDLLLVEKESKVEDDLARGDGNFSKSLDHGGASGSSSSSRSCSDDESHGTKFHKEVEIVGPVVESVTTADLSSEGTNVVAIEELHDPVVENKHVVLEAISSADEMQLAAKNSATPDLVKPPYEKSEGKNLTSLEDNVDASSACKDAELDPKVEETVPAVEKLVTYSNPKVCISQTAEDQLTVSYDAPAAASENGANYGENLGINEPVLRPVPHQVQTTSWKSCCGLFEVFAGSGR